jgi:hypothetical protein
MRFGFFDQLPCPPGYSEQFICYFNQGGLMPPAMVRESMTRFAREVMPHCR